MSLGLPKLASSHWGHPAVAIPGGGWVSPACQRKAAPHDEQEPNKNPLEPENAPDRSDNVTEP